MFVSSIKLFKIKETSLVQISVLLGIAITGMLTVYLSWNSVAVCISQIFTYFPLISEEMAKGNCIAPVYRAKLPNKISLLM